MESAIVSSTIQILLYYHKLPQLSIISILFNVFLSKQTNCDARNDDIAQTKCHALTSV